MNRKEIKEHILESIASGGEARIYYDHKIHDFSDLNGMCLLVIWREDLELYKIIYDDLKKLETDFNKYEREPSYEKLCYELDINIHSTLYDSTELDYTLGDVIYEVCAQRLYTDVYSGYRIFSQHELDKLVAFIYYNYRDKHVS